MLDLDLTSLPAGQVLVRNALAPGGLPIISLGLRLPESPRLVVTGIMGQERLLKLLSQSEMYDVGLLDAQGNILARVLFWINIAKPSSEVMNLSRREIRLWWQDFHANRVRPTWSRSRLSCGESGCFGAARLAGDTTWAASRMVSSCRLRWSSRSKPTPVLDFALLRQIPRRCLLSPCTLASSIELRDAT